MNDHQPPPPPPKQSTSKILVTGGAGYIGSHVVLDLLEQGLDLVVIDNFSNSNIESLHRVEKITGRSATIYDVNICDEAGLKHVFTQEPTITVVMHFAGLKSVSESFRQPLSYYENNVAGTLCLLRVMQAFKCYRMIFSSSATVYGTASAPLRETSPTGTGISNPYGQSKYMIEQMLHNMAAAPDSPWSLVALRYFNPIGAHASGLIGEDPQDIPNNLIPYVTQVCVGQRSHVTVHGNDYDTPDGTGVRDFIHVVDLARGHTAALKKLPEIKGFHAYNLGSGQGYSVLDIIKTMERVSGVQIKYEIGPRRLGDLGMVYAIPTKAHQELKWTTEKTLEDMCLDSWRWQSKNPRGYRK